MTAKQSGLRGKVRDGTVVSDKMQKTVVVAIEANFRHRLYKKTVRRVRRFLAHDEREEARLGDRVRIVEAAPISRRKRWRLVEVLARAELPEVAPESIDLELLGEVKAEEPEVEAPAAEEVAPEAEPVPAEAEAEPAAPEEAEAAEEVPEVEEAVEAEPAEPEAEAEAGPAEEEPEAEAADEPEDEPEATEESEDETAAAEEPEDGPETAEAPQDEPGAADESEEEKPA